MQHHTTPQPHGGNQNIPEGFAQSCQSNSCFSESDLVAVCNEAKNHRAFVELDDGVAGRGTWRNVLGVETQTLKFGGNVGSVLCHGSRGLWSEGRKGSEVLVDGM